MNKIRIGIAGYGNIGRGVEVAIAQTPDMRLDYIFTRRDPESITVKTKEAKVLPIDDVLNHKDDIDVMILCGGSANDLPQQGPQLAAHFNTVDSFDTHAKIPAYFKSMDDAAKNTVSIISVGWDPGLFSIYRLLSQGVLPVGNTYTFWGSGVSQGHSNAIRRIEGVKDAIQYTVPIQDAVDAVRSGSNPTLNARQMHKRECYVVADDGADKAAIEQAIKTMPNYFDGNDTYVHFISQEELNRDHAKMPHGGLVIRGGKTDESTQIMEFSLTLDSNPEFTAAALAAYARAALRMQQQGQTGAKSVLDVPPAYMSDMSPEEQRRLLL